MSEQNKINFRYGTHFFGKISRIEKNIRIELTRVASKCLNCFEKLIKLLF